MAHSLRVQAVLGDLRPLFALKYGYHTFINKTWRLGSRCRLNPNLRASFTVQIFQRVCSPRPVRILGRSWHRSREMSSEGWKLRVVGVCCRLEASVYECSFSVSIFCLQLYQKFADQARSAFGDAQRKPHPPAFCNITVGDSGLGILCSDCSTPHW